MLSEPALPGPSGTREQHLPKLAGNEKVNPDTTIVAPHPGNVDIAVQTGRGHAVEGQRSRQLAQKRARLCPVLRRNSVEPPPERARALNLLGPQPAHHRRILPRAVRAQHLDRQRHRGQHHGDPDPRYPPSSRHPATAASTAAHTNTAAAQNRHNPGNIPGRPLLSRQSHPTPRRPDTNHA